VVGKQREKTLLLAILKIKHAHTLHLQ